VKAIEMRSIGVWRSTASLWTTWDELNLLDLSQQIGMIPAFELQQPAIPERSMMNR
jgi:hypothetical protein